MNNISPFVVVILIATGYALPVLIAIMRGHPDVLPIGVINIFLGATGLGWVVALAWAVKRFDPALAWWQRDPPPGPRGPRGGPHGGGEPLELEVGNDNRKSGGKVIGLKPRRHRAF